MLEIYWIYRNILNEEKYFQLKKCKNKDGDRVGKEKKWKESGTVCACSFLNFSQHPPVGSCADTPCAWGNVRHGGSVWLPSSSTQRHFPPCCVVPTKPPSFALALLISRLLTVIKTLLKSCSPISDHFSHSDLHPKVPSTSMLLTSAQTQTCNPLPPHPKCWDDHPVHCHSW